MANLKDTLVLGKLTATDSIIADKFKGPLEGNADTATKFKDTKTITFDGDVSGSCATDFENEVVISLEVNNDSHTHTCSKITDLTTTLSSYLSTANKYTDDEITKLTKGAPDALKTLDALAQALGDDESFSTTVLNEISKKVAQSGGKMTGLLEAHGGISLNSSTEQANTPPYILGIKAFADGGNVTWSARANVSVGHADRADTAANATLAATATVADATFTKSISGDTHAVALKNHFDTNKATTPRNKLLSFYSSAYGNGSQCMGYFLNGYNDTPYGGFFVAHYNVPRYVGIQNGTYTEWELSKVGHTHSNYLPLAGGTVSGKTTFTGGVDIRGAAASKPLIVRGIVGSDGDGTVDALYLQYGANKPVYFGNGGSYTISADGSQYSGNAASATKLATARNFTIGNTAKSFDGSAAVSWSSNEIGYCYQWNAQVQGVTWSRICKIPAAVSTEGSKYILNISATRDNVVYNDTFIITAHHSSNGKIIKIAGNNYTSGHQIRLLVDKDGHSYIDLYDNAYNITATTKQTVHCRLIPIFVGTTSGSNTPTLYTDYTVGTALPTGYTVKQTMTITSDDMQGNLGGNASTSSKWATARTISIDSAAGTTGTSIDGSANATLKIPSTITGFSSITSAAFLAKTTTGDASVKTQNNNGEVSLLTSTNRGLYDNTNSAWIIFRPKDTTETRVPAWVSKGGTSRPVYFTSDGMPAAITSVGVAYGGTGQTSWTTNRLIYASAATTLATSSHYINETKLSINSTSAPTQNFYVNGTSYFNGLSSWEHNKPAINFRPSHANYDCILSYQTHGNEAMVFSTKNDITSFIFINGEDTSTNIASPDTASSRWTHFNGSEKTMSGGTVAETNPPLVPGLQIKKNCVAIGTLIANDVNPDHRLLVSGNVKVAGNILITGHFFGAAHSSSWYNGRDNALLSQTSSVGYAPVVSMKTTNGSWEMSHYNYDNWHDQLLFCYVTDTDYQAAKTNSSYNRATQALRLTKEGNLTLTGTQLKFSSAKFTYNTTDKCIDVTFN